MFASEASSPAIRNVYKCQYNAVDSCRYSMLMDILIANKLINKFNLPFLSCCFPTFAPVDSSVIAHPQQNSCSRSDPIFVKTGLASSNFYEGGACNLIIAKKDHNRCGVTMV